MQILLLDVSKTVGIRDMFQVVKEKYLKTAENKLERETGLEPATSSLGSWHSTTELLPLNFDRFSKADRK